MTSQLPSMLASFFARNNLNDFLPLSDHDDNLTPDVLTDLTLNYEWRLFVIHQLDTIMDTAVAVAPEAEREALTNQFLALFADFYS